MRWLALLLLLTSCHREVKQDIKIQEEDVAKTVKAAEEKTVEIKHQDPVDVDFKITRGENALVVQEPDGTVEVTPVVKGRPTVLPKGAKVIGTVPLVETTRDESKHIGAKDQEKTKEKKSTEDSESDKKLVAAAKLSDIVDVGPDWEFYGTIIAIVLAVLGAGYFYLKCIKKAVWL